MNATTLSKTQRLETIANRLRRDSLIATDAAGSGHPTSCLSCAEIIAVLFFDTLRFDLDDPRNEANDHFVLSKGHAAPILWAALKQAGAVSEEQIRKLRQYDSTLEGHPTPRQTFVDIATGSLGQGLSAGLGMALIDHREKRSNRTYVLTGDGETAEGSLWEAAALASHLKIGNLTWIIDANGYGQTGPTMQQHDLETYRQRLAAFGWDVQLVEDGHDVEALQKAIKASQQNQAKPTAIVARTIKGKGVPSLEGDKGNHGKPAPDLEEALSELPADTELDEEPTIQAPPKQKASVYLPSVFDLKLSVPADAPSKALSPREAFGLAARQLAERSSRMLFLDGDVSNSTYTQSIRDELPDQFAECFIAEQNMVGMALGAAQMGRLPFVSTFSAFLTRAFDQIRMCAVSHASIRFAGTHAGVATGEDGPSQMGLEDIAMFRSIPGSLVLQPCDTVSTFRCVDLMVQHSGISYLRLFRPKAEPLYAAETEFKIGGSHTLRRSEEDRVAIIASGITTRYALEAAEALAAEGVSARVIDCYSVKPIDAETIRLAARETGSLIIVEDHYRGGGLADLALEAVAGMSFRWKSLAIDQVPRSGSQAQLAAACRIDSKSIAEAARELVGSAPNSAQSASTIRVPADPTRTDPSPPPLPSMTALPTNEGIHERALELAAIEERPGQPLALDYENARRELSDALALDATASSVEEPAIESPPEQPSAYDENERPAREARQGVNEAAHDQMIAARRRSP